MDWRRSPVLFLLFGHPSAWSTPTGEPPSFSLRVVLPIWLTGLSLTGAEALSMRGAGAVPMPNDTIMLRRIATVSPSRCEASDLITQELGG